jgi:putative ABC transport system permease protein
MERGVAPDPAVLSARLSAEFGTNIPVRQVSHLPETLSPWLREPRRQTLLYSTIGLIGLLLAGIGLHAVASLEGTRRQTEIGVRMSLGATTRDLHQLLFSAVFPPVIVGLGAGLMLGWGGSRSLDALLFEAEAPGLLTYISTALVVLVAATLAGLRPVRRAARVDPAELLRV